MRLYISDNKNSIILFLHNYLDRKITSTEPKLIVNGREIVGEVTKTEIDDISFDWIKIHINDEIVTIPFNNDSKVRLDKGLYFFETDSHTTLIYN